MLFKFLKIRKEYSFNPKLVIDLNIYIYMRHVFIYLYMYSSHCLGCLKRRYSYDASKRRKVLFR